MPSKLLPAFGTHSATHQADLVNKVGNSNKYRSTDRTKQVNGILLFFFFFFFAFNLLCSANLIAHYTLHTGGVSRSKGAK